MAPPKGRHRDQVGDCSGSSLCGLCDESLVLVSQKGLKLVLVTVLKNNRGAATSLLLQAVGFLALLGPNGALFVAQARTAPTAICAGDNRAIFAY
jgi:hypothetical protein